MTPKPKWIFVLAIGILISVFVSISVTSPGPEHKREWRNSVATVVWLTNVWSVIQIDTVSENLSQLTLEAVGGRLNGAQIHVVMSTDVRTNTLMRVGVVNVRNTEFHPLEIFHVAEILPSN